MIPTSQDVPDDWFESVWQLHTRDLAFSELRRALQALSTRYVQGRSRLSSRSPLDTAGKRAAFAVFYAPLHMAIVAAIARDLGPPGPGTLVDLGCGTGVGVAAWALAAKRRPRLLGIDRHSWALEQACRTWRRLGLDGRTRRGDLAAWSPRRGRASSVLAAWALNELHDDARARLQPELLAAAAGGCRILIVEPIATRAAPWWSAWATAFAPVGGVARSHEVRPDLPERCRELDRAAGLDHTRVRVRTLAIGCAAPGVPASSGQA